MDVKKTQVILLGMHRSGTSLTSSFLQSMGIMMGEKLLPASIGNKHGHFEDEEVLKINEAILKSKGLNMLTTNHFKDYIKVKRSIGEELRREMFDFVNKRNSIYSIWGWKEPRSVLTFNEWISFVDNPVLIVIYRDYREVVQSLVKRGTDYEVKINPINALRSWILYNIIIIGIIKENRNGKLLVCSVNDVIEDPQQFQKKVRALIPAGLKELDFNQYKKEDLSQDVNIEINKLIDRSPILKTKSNFILRRLNSLNNFYQ